MDLVELAAGYFLEALRPGNLDAGACRRPNYILPVHRGKVKPVYVRQVGKLVAESEDSHEKEKDDGQEQAGV